MLNTPDFSYPIFSHEDIRKETISNYNNMECEFLTVLILTIWHLSLPRIKYQKNVLYKWKRMESWMLDCDFYFQAIVGPIGDMCFSSLSKPRTRISLKKRSKSNPYHNCLAIIYILCFERIQCPSFHLKIHFTCNYYSFKTVRIEMMLKGLMVHFIWNMLFRIHIENLLLHNLSGYNRIAAREEALHTVKPCSIYLTLHSSPTELLLLCHR